MQEKFNSQFELIKFVEGIPMDENEIVSDVTVPLLIVFDDMLGEKDEEKIKLWFTRKGHHRNASVIYITQNMFQQSKSSRTISLNSRYMILFRNERGKNQIKKLAQRMQAPHLLLAYEDATRLSSRRSSFKNKQRIKVENRHLLSLVYRRRC